MMRFAPLVVAAGLIVASIPALAQSSGVYIGIFGGVGFLGEQDIDTDSLIVGIPVESDTNIKYDPGYRVGAYVGYQLDTSIRLQFDVSYMTTDADNTVEIIDDEIESEQETTILSGTAGVFFDLWPIGPIAPYVGGGAGIAQIEVDNKDGGNDLGDSKQTVLTVFGEAGLPFNFTPEFAIVPSFRFSWYNTEDKTDDIVVNAGVNEAEIGSIGEGLYESQLLLSARYSF